MRPLLSRLSDADMARFWASIDTPTQGCWTWLGSERHVHGYGIFRRREGGRRPKMFAHRIALALRLGRDPVGLACHACGNSSCVRPSHLYEGTHAENSRDMVEHGRSTRGKRIKLNRTGEANTQAKLTAEKVAEARRRYAAGERATDIAREHGVTLSTMFNAISRVTWRHVP